jgi:hypothetical protein
MEIFQILSRDEQIVAITPYNPFAPKLLESLNQYPPKDQLTLLSKFFLNSGVKGTLKILKVNGIEAINADYNVVIYTLEISNHVHSPVSTP